MSGKLQDKVALVTGGASGIGEACVRLFAQEGAKLVIADRDQANGQAVVSELNRNGVEAIFVEADVANSESVQTMVKAATDHFRTVDVLVSSAGVGSTAQPISSMDEEKFDRVLAINLRGVFLTMKYVLQVMLAQGGGAIVNVASIGGMRGMPVGADYAAAKGGVIQLTRSAALEGAARNIRVNAICPGWVETPMVDAVLQREGESYRQTMLAYVPMRRLGQPEEIARAILFLAVDAPYMTGAPLIIDGGMLA